MKAEILEKIKQLGGNIDNVKGNSLTEDILSITFDTVLYQKPEDTPWQTAEDAEPIYGMENLLMKTKNFSKQTNKLFIIK